MRIGAAATSYVVGVTVIATVASTTLAWREWDHLAAIENTEKLIRVIGAANRFVEAMALERGVYNQVIVSVDDSPEVKRRLVRERNAFTDKVFDDTFAALSQI